jgi:hypothetical protein
VDVKHFFSKFREGSEEISGTLEKIYVLEGGTNRRMSGEELYLRGRDKSAEGWRRVMSKRQGQISGTPEKSYI